MRQAVAVSSPSWRWTHQFSWAKLDLSCYLQRFANGPSLKLANGMALLVSSDRERRIHHKKLPSICLNVSPSSLRLWRPWLKLCAILRNDHSICFQLPCFSAQIHYELPGTNCYHCLSTFNKSCHSKLPIFGPLPQTFDLCNMCVFTTCCWCLCKFSCNKANNRKQHWYQGSSIYWAWKIPSIGAFLDLLFTTSEVGLFRHLDLSMDLDECQLGEEVRCFVGILWGCFTVPGRKFTIWVRYERLNIFFYCGMLKTWVFWWCRCFQKVSR